jgi:hypothetical protein
MASRFFRSLLFVCTGVFVPYAQVSTRSFKGQAYEPGTSTVLYSEKFDMKMDGNTPVSLKTEYRNPAGVFIAERTLDFSRHTFKPDYKLTDERDGYEEGARVLSQDGSGKKGSTRIRVYVRENREKPLREKVIEVPEPSVIDGGFNVFIKSHWDPLMAGKRVAFNFVAPARRDWFAFEVVPAGFDDASTEEASEAESPSTRTFVVRPQNGALRLLVAPIRVTYDVATRRITEYRGISNVNNSKGKSFKVRIAYPNLGP